MDRQSSRLPCPRPNGPCSGSAAACCVPAYHWGGPEVLTAPSTPVNSEVVCPLVANQQGGAVLCVAYGLAI
eukprot:567732-Prymnesium_polylepis.1